MYVFLLLHTFREHVFIYWLLGAVMQHWSTLVPKALHIRRKM